MQNIFRSVDSGNYKKILQVMKEEQRIIHLEELIDDERIKIKRLEQEKRLLWIQIETLKKKRIHDYDKNRSASISHYYEDNEFKEKKFIRNTLMSTSYKD